MDRLTCEVEKLPATALELGLELPEHADTIYFGGGTPSLLNPSQLECIFAALRSVWSLTQNPEITLEAAPGQVSAQFLDGAMRMGVNRISLGVQSFVDRESRAVGRLHTADLCRREIAQLQSAGVPRLSVDLIAGLPFQTAASWGDSLQQVIDCGVEHVSVYMLETDGESRLGTEVERIRSTTQLSVLGQHARYHADAVPSDEVCADLYLQACETLEAHGIRQYEISNFARSGAESLHNLKYWWRAPYAGVGLDAHSMLPGLGEQMTRFQNADDLESYLAAKRPSELLRVTAEQAFEEAVFLGLRLREGVPVAQLASFHLPRMLNAMLERARELAEDGLMILSQERLALTPRGRVLSSSVFGELLTTTA